MIRLAHVAAAISRVETSATRLVVIDGLGGAGKTVLAEALAEELGASVVQGDDFYRPSAERQQSGSEPEAIGASFDLRRLELQVMAPLSRGEDARYRRYDWDSDRLGGWVSVPSRDTVVVEGVYLLRTEDAYVSAMRPDAAAMLVIDGQRRTGIDPRRSVVVLEARPPFDGLV